MIVLSNDGMGWIYTDTDGVQKTARIWGDHALYEQLTERVSLQRSTETENGAKVYDYTQKVKNLQITIDAGRFKTGDPLPVKPRKVVVPDVGAPYEVDFVNLPEPVFSATPAAPPSSGGALHPIDLTIPTPDQQNAMLMMKMMSLDSKMTAMDKKMDQILSLLNSRS